MKVLQIILGVVVVIAGIYCCTYPIATQVSLAGVFVIVMAIGMLVDGVGNVLSWNDARKRGMGSGWALFSGVVGIILGVALLGCDFFASGVVYATFCACFLCIWLIVGGVSRIGTALGLRKLGNALMGGQQSPAGGWVPLMVMGVLMIIAGVCCIGSPMVLISFMGIVFGVSMIIAGVSLVTLAMASPSK